MSIDLNSKSLPQTCGVNLYYNFDDGYNADDTESCYLGGADLACAGFIDTPECKQAYLELKERFNIVYQSTPRHNRYSGNQFFFVVYDGKKEN